MIGADGRVAPCFFIPGPARAPRAPDLGAALESEPMRAQRAAIRAGRRPECERCVCTMWRDPPRSRARLSRTGRGACLTHRRLVARRHRPGALGCSPARPLDPLHAHRAGIVRRLSGSNTCTTCRSWCCRGSRIRSATHWRVLRQLSTRAARPRAAVLDIGTGTGVCALFAARRARPRRGGGHESRGGALRAADALLTIWTSASKCGTATCSARSSGERFDLVLFNPPFLLGAPNDHRDAAWRRQDAARRSPPDSRSISRRAARRCAALVVRRRLRALRSGAARARLSLGGLRAPPLRQRDLHDRACDASRAHEPTRRGECCWSTRGSPRGGTRAFRSRS